MPDASKVSHRWTHFKLNHPTLKLQGGLVMIVTKELLMPEMKETVLIKSKYTA